MARRYVALAPGAFASRSAKTAHGVIAYAADPTVAVVDPEHAGRRVREVVPYLASDAPIVADVASALRFAPTSLLVGVAPTGGALPPDWRRAILAALDAGLEVVSGLHDELARDPEFAAAARRAGTTIWDVRVPPPVPLFSGRAYGVAARVVLTVGSDCAVGKMTASLELTRAARERGERARFVATGQTGILIAGGGIAIDRVVADFAPGAAEQLVLDNADADLLFVEGQGAINHPAYAPVSLALLFGAAPDALVLVHRAGRAVIEDFATPILPYRTLIRTYEALCAGVKPARVVGVALNTADLDDAGARAAIAEARAATGLAGRRRRPLRAAGALRRDRAARRTQDATVARGGARVTRALAAGALALLVATACTKVETNATSANGRHPWTVAGTVRIGFPDEPDGLNPMYTNTAAADEADALLLAPVFRYDQHGEFFPELATDVPTYRNGGISADGRTITLHWRRGVVWADGAPLTARDLRFTWRAVMDPRNNTKTRAGWDDVATIDTRDPYTAVVRLKRPNADVLGIFASGGAAYPPLPEHLLGKLPDLNRAPFNVAPLVERARGSSSAGTTARRSSSRRTRATGAVRPSSRTSPGASIPNTDTQLAQLTTHEIDVYPNVSENQIARLGSIAGIATQTRLVANWRHLDFNTRKPALADARVRRAIAQGVDWDRINATVYLGVNQRAVSDIVPTSWAAPSIRQWRYDPAAARRLLDAAGFVPGPDGIRRRGDARAARSALSTGTNKPANERAEVQIQQALRPLGIDVAIKNYPVSYLFAQNGPFYGGTYDMSWSVDTNGPDPDNQALWSGDFIPPHGANTLVLRGPGDHADVRSRDPDVRSRPSARRSTSARRSASTTSRWRCSSIGRTRRAPTTATCTTIVPRSTSPTTGTRGSGRSSARRDAAGRARPRRAAPPARRCTSSSSNRRSRRTPATSRGCARRPAARCTWSSRSASRSPTASSSGPASTTGTRSTSSSTRRSTRSSQNWRRPAVVRVDARHAFATTRRPTQPATRSCSARRRRVCRPRCSPRTPSARCASRCARAPCVASISRSRSASSSTPRSRASVIPDSRERRLQRDRRDRTPRRRLHALPGAARVLRAHRRGAQGRLSRPGLLGAAGSRVRRSERARRARRARAGRARLEPHGPHVHRRRVGRVALPRAVSRRVRERAAVRLGGRRARPARRADHGRVALRAAQEQTRRRCSCERCAPYLREEFERTAADARRRRPRRDRDARRLSGPASPSASRSPSALRSRTAPSRSRRVESAA